MYQEGPLMGTSFYLLWTWRQGSSLVCSKVILILNVVIELSANQFLFSVYSMSHFLQLNVSVLEISVDLFWKIWKNRDREGEGAVRKDNSSVTGWDLCSSVCTLAVRVCGCACVCVGVGGVKVTLNGVGACVNVCASVQIPLERVRWRLSSASTSICREGTNKLLNTQQTASQNYL